MPFREESGRSEEVGIERCTHFQPRRIPRTRTKFKQLLKLHTSLDSSGLLKDVQKVQSVVKKIAPALYERDWSGLFRRFKTRPQSRPYGLTLESTVAIVLLGICA